MMGSGEGGKGGSVEEGMGEVVLWRGFVWGGGSVEGEWVGGKGGSGSYLYFIQCWHSMNLCTCVLLISQHRASTEPAQSQHKVSANSLKACEHKFFLQHNIDRRRNTCNLSVIASTIVLYITILS